MADTIKIKTSDGKIFDVDLEIAKTSKTIETMVENLPGDSSDVPIYLSKIDSETLQLIIKWSQYHVNNPLPINEETLSGEEYPLPTSMTEWDAQFMEISYCQIFKLIVASNFLDINELLELSCKAFAKFIKDKTPDQIRKYFHITKPKSPETSRDSSKNKVAEE